MATTTATLSGAITDVIGEVNPRYTGRIVMVVESNTTGSILRDPVGNVLMAGARRVEVDGASGAYSVELVTTTSGDILPADDRLYQVTLIYPSGVPGQGNVTARSGWFEFTADASLADPGIWQGIEVTAVSSAVYASLTAMLAEAEAQAAAAGDSADQAAASALEAAALVLSDLGTTDGQTRALIENPLSQTAGALSTTIEAANEVQVPPLVADAIAADGTVAQAAADAVTTALVDASVAPAEQRDPDEFTVRFDDSATPLLRATEAEGITSRVQAAAVSVGAAPIMEGLTDDQGWDFAVRYADGEVAFGRRVDGTWYPDSLGGERASPFIANGDSLLAGGQPMLDLLAADLGAAVINNGVGGQTSSEIAARQGGTPARLTVTGNLIPASGSVAVTAYDANLLSHTYDGTFTQAGTLAGVPGLLSAVRASAVYTYTFTRTDAGTARHCPAGTPFVTGSTYRGHVPINCVGRNDFKTAAPADIATRHRTMLEWSLDPTEGIILSIPPWVGEENGTGDRTKLDAANAAIRAAFPAMWVDWALYLRSTDTLAAAGITPTATDIQNIADGLTPASFRYDAGHFNAAAYAVLHPMIRDELNARKKVS